MKKVKLQTLQALPIQGQRLQTLPVLPIQGNLGADNRKTPNPAVTTHPGVTMLLRLRDLAGGGGDV